MPQFVKNSPPEIRHLAHSRVAPVRISPSEEAFQVSEKWISGAMTYDAEVWIKSLKRLLSGKLNAQDQKHDWNVIGAPNVIEIPQKSVLVTRILLNRSPNLSKIFWYHLKKFATRSTNPGEDMVLLRAATNAFGTFCGGYKDIKNGVTAPLDLLRTPGLPSNAYWIASRLISPYWMIPTERFPRMLKDVRTRIEQVVTDPINPECQASVLTMMAESIWSDNTPTDSLTKKLLGSSTAADKSTIANGTIFLRSVLEPELALFPGMVDAAAFERLNKIFAANERFPYSCAAIAAHPSVECSVAQSAQAVIQTSERFPIRKEASAIVHASGAKTLIINNINDGQGDELIRVGMTIQSLVNSNPTAKVTVVTQRPYLYDHPRVTTLDLALLTKKGSTLEGDFSTIINFYDHAFGFAHSLNRIALQRAADKKCELYVGADKKGHDFVYSSLRLGSNDYIGPSGLDLVETSSVYDPPFRLSVQLGLSPAIPFEPPVESILVGTRNLIAEKAWHDICAKIMRPAQEKQKVLMCNIFGGESSLKGFAGSHGIYSTTVASKILSGYIDLGYSVVLLPNGRTWGDTKQALELHAALPRKHRPFTFVAAQPEIEPRMVKYFASYADHVMTVEGGFMHLSYLLGKSFDLFMTSGAGEPKWLPRARVDQRVQYLLA